MLFSTKAEYGVRLMVELGRRCGDADPEASTPVSLNSVAEAHTNKEIAEILHLSEKTVENHRSNAMRKFGMRDRVELVRYAIRRGLIEP